MANTFTNLIPIIMLALDMVAQEQVGFIPSVYKNSSAEKAALNQTIRYPISAPITLESFSEGQHPADSGDTAPSYGDMTISKEMVAPVRISGEDRLGLQSAGTYEEIMKARFAEAFRALRNQIEADIAATYKYASRAYGTGGTTPFASSMADIAAVRKILVDNGCPLDDLSLVIDTAAGLNMRSLTQYLQVSAAGNDKGLREGVLLPLQGMNVRESAQVAYHTKGAGTLYDINKASTGEVAGETTLTLDGGTVNTTGIKSGDVITFAGDANKYIVTTGLTDAAGDIVIARPGLLATVADAVEMTIGNSYRANMAFHRSAIHLLTRGIALPEEGDSAADKTVVTDPVTGISYDVLLYKEHGRVKYEIGLAWGVKLVKPEFAALLLG